MGKVKLADKTGERTSSSRHIVFDVVRFLPVLTSPSTAVQPRIVAPAIMEVAEPSLPGTLPHGGFNGVAVGPNGSIYVIEDVTNTVYEFAR